MRIPKILNCHGKNIIYEQSVFEHVSRIKLLLQKTLSLQSRCFMNTYSTSRLISQAWMPGGVGVGRFTWCLGVWGQHDWVWRALVKFECVFAVPLFYPKYRFGHLGNYVILLWKLLVCSKHPKNIVFSLENRVTATHNLTVAQSTWQAAPLRRFGLQCFCFRRYIR